MWQCRNSFNIEVRSVGTGFNPLEFVQWLGLFICMLIYVFVYLFTNRDSMYIIIYYSLIHVS